MNTPNTVKPEEEKAKTLREQLKKLRAPAGK